MSPTNGNGGGTDTSDGQSESDEEFDTDIEDPEVEQSLGFGFNGPQSDEEERMLWVLRSGEEVKLEGLDLKRSLFIRVGFAAGDDHASVR